MTKILPEKNLALDHENAKKETLTFEIDKTDANEKYEIEAFQRNRLPEKTKIQSKSRKMESQMKK